MARAEKRKAEMTGAIETLQLKVAEETVQIEELELYMELGSEIFAA